MARVWLVLFFVLFLAPGCLVVDKPEFEPPTRTRPQLIAVTPTTEFLRIRPSDPIFNFNYEVLSEDVGQDMFAITLIDYGIEGPGGDPWRALSFQRNVPAGSLADGPRPHSFQSPIQPGVLEGCHTLTLLVSHDLRESSDDFANCPSDPDDFATLTWFYSLCTGDDLENDCDYDCPFADENTFQYCPGDTTGIGETASP